MYCRSFEKYEQPPKKQAMQFQKVDVSFGSALYLISILVGSINLVAPCWGVTRSAMLAGKGASNVTCVGSAILR